MRIEYHRTLIADGVRVRALHDALKATIVPGRSIVSDIGAGTGLIGVMAEKLGAKEVHLYEAAEVAAVARKVLSANRTRRCRLYECRSTEFDDPPRADIVVSETLGNYALEEGIGEIMADARRRHLKPGGALIPSRITQFVAPVVASRVDSELRAWDRAAKGLDVGVDLSPARALTLNNIYVRTIAPQDLFDGMKSASMWDQVELGKDRGSTRKGEASWTLRRPTTVYGFALWWAADLAGVSLSTAPDAPPTHWEQLYLPLLDPIRATGGQRVLFSVRSRTSRESGTTIAWTVTHDADGAILSRQGLDLKQGYLP